MICAMSRSQEDAASAILEAHLGWPVIHHDNQSSPGMYDLEIRYPAGRLGAVEVTSAENEQLAADFGALHKNPILRDRRLQRGWLAVLRPSASVKVARSRLADMLVLFEAVGISEASVYTVRSLDEDDRDVWARRQLDDAEVETVKAGSMQPGVVGITGPMRVGWLSTNPDDVVTFVEDFVASRPSDVEKLLRSGADERHLFVFSGAFSTGWQALRALGLDVPQLPVRAPSLPVGITHVWVAAEVGARPSRIAVWSADAGWQQAGTIT